MQEENSTGGGGGGGGGEGHQRGGSLAMLVIHFAKSVKAQNFHSAASEVIGIVRAMCNNV